MYKLSIRVQEVIDDKLIDFTLKHNVSLSDLFRDYETRVHNIKSIYREPSKHLSKIYVMAYKGTVKKYG